MQKLISVIIPTYNRSEILGETLDSIINQTFSDWECLVIDDGSNDDTEELMEYYSSKDERIKYFARPEKVTKGANACRNYGFDLSSGKYIQWFDSDDLMLPGKLALQIEEFFKNPQLDICLSQYSLNDAEMNLIEHRPYPKGNYLINYLTERAFFNLPTALFKRESLRNLTLDETLYKAQEVEFFLRYLQKPDLEISYISKETVKVRLHDKNITSTFNAGNKNAINSEMKVRLKGIEFILNNGTKKDIRLVLRYYYLFLVKILKQNEIGLFYKYSFKLFDILPVSYYGKVNTLLLLGPLYLIMGRTPYRFRNLF